MPALAPERLLNLYRVATMESIGASTRIEGVKLSDREVGALLSNLEIEKFKNRGEQEVAGYEVIDLTENVCAVCLSRKYHRAK